MEVSKYINPNIIQDGSIDGDKKIKEYPPLQKGSGENSVCQDSCTASGKHSHAEGYHTKASGAYSHAEGQITAASGGNSHAEGYYTKASGAYSHAEGLFTIASGYKSHAEGNNTKASGDYSHAEGGNNTASGAYSHAEGNKTKALNRTEHTEGELNLSIANKTVHTVGIGSAEDNVENRKNAEEIHFDGKKYVYGIGGYDGTNSQTEGTKTVQEVVEEAANTVQITYTELKSLRDVGTLVPGQQYHITDYQCTTTQTGTKSAEHAFDIIVTADDESALNEVARAVKHEFDDPEQDYFKDCNLSAWKIWYCLDNDTTRFAWADATNGKGVIYRMIDEWNNDVPYDFKNILFYRQWNEAKQLWSTISSDNTGVPCYTFSLSGNSSTTSFTDMSLLGSNSIYSNVIRKYVNDNKQTLSNICFFGNNCYSNTFGDNCSNNTFGNNCSRNTFGAYYSKNIFSNSCSRNSIGNSSYDNFFGENCCGNIFKNNCSNNIFGRGGEFNVFGNNCYNNSFGDEYKNNSLENNCYNNTFGDSCSNNSFGNSCSRNTFGDNCSTNSFGNRCYSNSFGNSCYSNSFGNSCYSNSFGNNCETNSFGNICYSNSLGNDCYCNTFGNNCRNSSFGNDCYDNTFGNSCFSIKFAPDSSASIKYNYYRSNHFGDNCECIIFKGKAPANNAQQVQNYNFAQGLQGTFSAYLTIDGVRGRSFETKVAKKSNDEVKIYCEADLIL